jgi:hypothetical protein
VLRLNGSTDLQAIHIIKKRYVVWFKIGLMARAISLSLSLSLSLSALLTMLLLLLVAVR